jgi:hypothetical protein
VVLSARGLVVMVAHVGLFLDRRCQGQQPCRVARQQSGRITRTPFHIEQLPTTQTRGTISHNKAEPLYHMHDCGYRKAVSAMDCVAVLYHVHRTSPRFTYGSCT